MTGSILLVGFERFYCLTPGLADSIGADRIQVVQHLFPVLDRLPFFRHVPKRQIQQF
ncbi:MAG: hypothetical protein JWN34_5411 [Bryobacterales bacterium]|nr:hypothetical protein [Bryobacterales bacterium]